MERRGGGRWEQQHAAGGGRGRGRNPRPDQQPYQPQPQQGGYTRGGHAGGRGAAVASAGRGGGAFDVRGRGGAAASSSSGAPAGALPERLVAAAADTSQPVAARVAALQQLHQALYSPDRQVEALQRLPSLWPRLVALLWDPQRAVCAAAAAPAGALGALAAQAAAAQQAQRGITSGAGGMLFDWLLPVLTKQSGPKGERLTTQQLTAILLAVRNCLAGVDAVTLSRYANAVLEACQGLLEGEATPPALVLPLLEVVMQAARHQHSLAGRFQDLVDLLLGWALEPQLPAAARLLLSRAFLAFQPQWQQRPGFAASLLGSLLSDLERFSGAASQPRPQLLAQEAGEGSPVGDAPAAAAAAGGGVEADKVLGLAPCALAILEASWQEGPEAEKQAAGAILRLMRCLAATLEHLQAQAPHHQEGPAPVPDMAPTLAELASHVSKLAELAARVGAPLPTPPAAPSAPGPGSPPGSPRPPPASAGAQQAKQPAKILQRGQPEQGPETSGGADASAGEGEAAGGSKGLAAAAKGEGGSVQLSTTAEAANLVAALHEVSLSQDAASTRVPAADPEHVGVALSMLPGSSGSGSGARTAPAGSATSSTAHSLRQAFQAALAFVEAALAMPSIAARPEAVGALLSLLRRWLGLAAVLQRLGAQAELDAMWGVAQAALLRGPGSAVARLRLASDAAVLQRTAELYLQLLQQFPAALPALLEEAGTQAQLVHPAPNMAQPSPPQAPDQAAAAAGAVVGGHTGGMRPPYRNQAAVLLRFDLQLLAVVLVGRERQRAAEGSVAALPAAWELLYRLVRPSGLLLPGHQALWCQAFDLFQHLSAALDPAAATTTTQQATQPAADAALRTLRLLSALLRLALAGSSGKRGGTSVLTEAPDGSGPGSLPGAADETVPLAVPPPAVRAVLAWLPEASAWALALTAEPLGLGSSAPPACLPSAAWASPGSTWGAAAHEVRHAASATARLAASAAVGTVRAAALGALGKLLAPELGDGSSGSDRAVLSARLAVQAVLLEDGSLVEDAALAAVAASADLDLAAVQQAQQLLQRASAALCLAAAGGTAAAPCVAGFGAAAHSVAASMCSVRFALALQPQRRVFQPAQLSKLLGYLTQSAPPAVLFAGAERPFSQLQDWLSRLLHGLADMPAQALKAARNPYEGPILFPEDVTTLHQAALLALHEAARQLVAARLKTHLGGPSETFAALDQALQRLAAEAGAAAGRGATTAASSLTPGWLFLEFLHALEQGAFNAHTGCVGRPPPAGGSAALAFFWGNRKVCADWFALMSPLALRSAAALGHHPLTVRLGLARLRHLEAHARQLAAQAQAAASVPAPAAVVTFSSASAASPSGAAGAAAAGGSGSWATTLLAPRGRQGPEASTGEPQPPAAASAPQGSPAAAEECLPAAAAQPANPAAALLAATQGSAPAPATPRLGQARAAVGRPGALLPVAPATAQRHAQQAQQLLAKVTDAAAVTARALCALRDADGVADLQAYCTRAFAPLWRLLGKAPGAAASSAAAAAAPLPAEVLGLRPKPADAPASTEAVAAAEAGGGASSSVPRAASTEAAWSWLEGVQLHAAGRYEAALERYRAAAQQPSSACPPPAKELVAALSAEAYAALGDWSGLQAWAQESPGAGRLPPAVPAHYLSMASWGAGDVAAAAGHLAQQAPSAAGSKAAGVLHAALASSLTTESTVLHSLLEREDAPAAGEAAAAVLQQAQLLESVGGGLERPTLLAAPLACLAALPPQGLQRQREVGPGQAPLPPSPFVNGLLRFSTWAPGGPGLAGGTYDTAPFASLLAAALGGAGGQAPGSWLGLLLGAAHAAASSGNGQVAAVLVAKADAELAEQQQQGQPAAEANIAWQEAARRHLGLASCCLALQQQVSGGDAAAGAGQDEAVWQAWRLLQESRGAAAIPAAAGPSAAAAALLLLHHWLRPAGAGELSSVRQQQLLQEARKTVASTQIPWPGSSQEGLGGPEEAGLLATAEQGGSNAASDSAGQALLAYAALKAGLAAAPQCAQLWWRLAEWAAGLSTASVDRDEAPQHAQQAHCAAFLAACQALSLGAGSSGGSPDELPPLLLILRLLSPPGQAPPSLPAATLHEGLSRVPATCWRGVVPQLLAALAGLTAPSRTAEEQQGGELARRSAAATVGEVRAAVLGLLRRVGQQAPAEVVLPALVELREPHPGNPGLQAALAELVQECTARHPSLVEQLCTLADGLSQAAVLWEEQWSTLLQEAAASAARALGALQAELGALPAEQQAEALQEGYLAAMAPSILLIKAGHEAASAPLSAATPGSSHEERMLGLLRPMLGALGEHLAQPPAAAAELPLRTEVIKQAASRVGQCLQERRLQLADVAPALAALRHTVIPVPGAAVSEEVVVVHSFLPTLYVLHTKTRPKRVTLLGSDGQQYKYLLKGKEDLRTDERLGQFLRAAGAALRGGSGGAASGGDLGGLEIHTFGVTPVARRVGLVQWVGNTAPLYELYASWHARRAERAALLAAVQAQQAKQAGRAPPHTPAPAQPPKPVAAFYSTLVPALKAAGVDPASPRDTWPLPVLQQVFRTLAAAAPRSTLADELWCGAAGAAHWWERQRSFAGSTAAMSMMGHLLGLGDRHLDNILLHKQHGGVVHLDFNVIFDRGASLKVPERVPFRLTQSLVAALGPAGAKGRFQLACERALRLLRASAEPLAALLGAAVSDPLVDWNAEDGEKARRWEFELSVALRGFALQQGGAAGELRAAAGASTAALAACGAALGGYLQLFGQAASAAAAGEESAGVLQQCQATLAESDGQEQAAATALREGQQAMQLMMAQAAPVADLAVKALQECQGWQERHMAVVGALLAEPPPALLAPPAVFDPAAAAAPLGLVTALAPGVAPLLEQALGMPASKAPFSSELLVQAACLDEAGRALLGQRAAAVGALMRHLQQYCAAVAALLGPDYPRTSLHARWAEAFQAGLALPVPQGFQRAGELAPQPENPAALLPAWRPLLAASAANAALLQRLDATQSGLQLERVDLALFANEAKERLLGLLGPDPCAPSVAALLAAFAGFARRQAGAVRALEAQQSLAAEGAGAAAEGAATLDSLQTLVLGFTTAAVAFQQAGGSLFDQLFTAADGSNRLDWLSSLVQGVDGMSSLALELQLAGPPLLALAGSQHAQQVSAGLATALSAAAAGGGSTAVGPAAQGGQGVGLAQALEGLAAQFPALGAMLSLLQQAKGTTLQLAAAAGRTAAAEQGGGAAAQQLWLARTASRMWEACLVAAAPPAQQGSPAAAGAEPKTGGRPEGEAGNVAAAAAGAEPAREPLPASRHVLAAWEACRSVLTAVVGELVAQRVAPAVAAAFEAAAGTFQKAAAAEEAAAAAAGGASSGGRPEETQQGAGGGRWGVEAQHAEHAELVPFTDFDDSLVPSSELLGELEPAGAEAVGGSPLAHAQHPELVPFAHFEDGLAGAGELSEPLEAHAGHAGDAEPDAVHAAHHGLAGPTLVPFSDLHGSGEGLLEPLEAGDDNGLEEAGWGAEGGEGAVALSGGSRDWEGPSQLSGLGATGSSQTSQQRLIQSAGTSGSGSTADVEQLVAALQSCAGACGALAAVDSQQYLTGLALQQGLQQAQQAAADLAQFEWLHEQALLEGGLQQGELGSWAAASGAGGGQQGLGGPALVHPLQWALRSPRAALLAGMERGLEELATLQLQLQQWQAQLGQLEQLQEEELSAVMLFAVPAFKGHQGAKQQWLGAAAAHAAALGQLAQAVLQFEGSRVAGAPGGGTVPGAAPPAAAAPAAAPGLPGPGLQQYQAVLQQMQRLDQAYLAADASITAAGRELAGVQQRRLEALALMHTAQAKAAEAEAQLGSVALPLIKATKQLGQALQAVCLRLQGMAGQAGVLQRTARRASRLCGVLRQAQHAQHAGQAQRDELAGAHRACLEAVQQLQAALRSAQQLPAAAGGLQSGVQAAQGALAQRKGRGEAAAREAAREVVALLRPAVAELRPQVDALPAAQQALGALPAALASLAQQAQRAAAQLPDRHGLAPHLRGLPALLGLAGEPEAGPSAIAEEGVHREAAELAQRVLAPKQPSMAQSVGLPALPGLGDREEGHCSGEAESGRAAFAAAVVASFREKLAGRRLPGAGGARGAEPPPAAAAVGLSEGKLARRLIDAATSEANLARMYEGWMPFV